MPDAGDTAARESLDVRVVSSEAEFDALAPEWDRLLENSDQHVYFLRWSWNRLWWRTFAPASARLNLVICRDATGTLVGLAPLYWRRHRTAGIPHAREILLLGTGTYSHTSEYLDLICLRGREDEVARAVAACLRGREDWDRLWLAQVPARSAVLPHFIRGMGSESRRAPCARSHHIDLRGGWEDFLSRLKPSFRSNLKYSLRRLQARHAWSFGRVEGRDEVEAAIRDLIALHQAWWRSRGEPGVFAFPSTAAFLEEATRQAQESGNLRLWSLAIDGRAAAILLAFIDRGVVHYFQSGLDPAYRRDSLGTVLIGSCIKDCLDATDVREFDLMAGDAHYKSAWSEDGRDSVEIVWAREGLRTLVFEATRSARLLRMRAVATVLPERLRAAGRRVLSRWRV